MKHLEPRTLSALADGELRGEALWTAEKHLEACEACRDVLAGISSQTAALGAALQHDPGEAYFSDFADRVVGRIAEAEKAGEAEAPGRGAAALAGDMLRAPIRLPWWQRPRTLALAGSVTAVIAAAGIVLLSARESTLTRTRATSPEVSRALRESGPANPPPAAEHDQVASEPGGGAPPAASLDDRGDGSASRGAAESEATSSLRAEPATGARAVSPPAAPAPARVANELAAPPAGAPATTAPIQERSGRGAEPSVLRKVDRDAKGESRGSTPPVSSFAAPPPPTSSSGVEPSPAEKLARAKRAAIAPADQKAAETKPEALLQEQPARDAAGANAPGAVAPAAGMEDRVAQTAAAAPGTVCGVVRDDAGRPLDGVMVSSMDGAHSARSGPDGRYCIQLPESVRELQLMAVGFRTARVSWSPGESLPETMMLSVAVLGTQGLSRADGSPVRVAPPAGPDGLEGQESLSPRAGVLPVGDAALRELPDSLRTLVTSVATRHRRALETQSAPALESAAVGYERLLPGVQGGAEIELYARIAECRALAWSRDRSARRTEAAIESLTRYIARAPAGSRRQTAARWLDRVRVR